MSPYASGSLHCTLRLQAYDLLKLNIRAYLSSIMMLLYPLQARWARWGMVGTFEGL